MCQSLSETGPILHIAQEIIRELTYKIKLYESKLSNFYKYVNGKLKGLKMK